MAAEKKEGVFFTFKDRPLVRNDDTIYYGNLFEKCVIIMQIIEKKKINELSVATKVRVQLWLTDEAVPPADRLLKTSEKSNLYDAVDIASIWLERALAS